MKNFPTIRSVSSMLCLTMMTAGFSFDTRLCPAQDHPFSSTPSTQPPAATLEVTPAQPPAYGITPAPLPNRATQLSTTSGQPNFDAWSLEKPDYSALKGKNFDQNLEPALEQMRLSINAMQQEIVLSKEYMPQHYSPQYHQVMEPLVSYVQLLRESGMNDAAEHILDTLPKSYDNNQPLFPDIRSRLQNMATRRLANTEPPVPQKKSPQEIAGILQSAQPDGNGYFNYSPRPQVMRDDYGNVIYPASAYGGMGGTFSTQPSDEQGAELKNAKDAPIKEKSYSAFARAFLAKEQPDLNDAMKWKEQLSRNTESRSRDYSQHLQCAVLLSAMGAQDAANQAVDQAMQNATKEAQRQNDQNRSHRVQVEGIVLREQHAWQTFIQALTRMGEYDAAANMAKQMRENLTKLQAAGENVIWNSTWNESFKNLATFAALEGEIDLALEYSERILTKQEQNNLMQSIARILANQEREEDLDRVTASKNYVPQPGMKLGNPESRFQKAKEIAETGTRDEALAALRKLLETDETNSRGIPRDPMRMNELGLLFLKFDDGENARKMFTMANDAIKTNMEQQGRNNYPGMYVQDGQFASLLAARCKAGLTDDTLGFVKTIKKVPGCIMLYLTLAEEIANDSNRAETLDLLNAAYEAAMTIEPNPGIPDISNPYQGNRNRFVFRNDYLWAVARASLLADCLPEAERFIKEAKTLDANIPVISYKVRLMLNPDSYHQSFQPSQRDLLWMQCVEKLLRKEKKNIPAAMIAADNIESPQMKNNAYAKIAGRMMGSPVAGHSGVGMGTIPAGMGVPATYAY